MENKFLVGSNYFFSCYDDFHSKDIDELVIVETDEFKYLAHRHTPGKCLFRLRRQPDKDTYISRAIQTRKGMVIGKFLVPELCQEMGITIEDLPKLQSLVDLLDARHQYEKIIYDAYLANQSFTLTDEQRRDAYKNYKETRK